MTCRFREGVRCFSRSVQQESPSYNSLLLESIITYLGRSDLNRYNTKVLVSEFDFHLPEKLIAQEPAEKRDASRLLVVRRADGTFTDSVFTELPAFLTANDLLVLNNTRVFPARLIGNRLLPDGTMGGKVEIFLVRELEPLVWEALVRPGKSLQVGTAVRFASDKLTAQVIERGEMGRRIIGFKTAGDFHQIIDEIGRTPLPPYIKRDEEQRLDAERYQTIYAQERGAIAAPTAGLHFTDELFGQLQAKDIETTQITLHVGYGTFQPVQVERVQDHKVEAERFTINEVAARKINQALNEKRRVIAVGTTTTRALESTQGTGVGAQESEVRGHEAKENDAVKSSPLHPFTPSPLQPVERQQTNLFIYPGYKFKVISGLVTNFHLPRSSLLMLVSAFAGRELILEAYQHAVRNEYRFYSYGDAMLIL
jgi:S-adenosylmethionine:tRNA ribosyltransferase-isomerase